jgi:hypothetical protein
MLSLISHFLLAAVLSLLTMPIKALVIYASWCNNPDPPPNDLVVKY